ncbi:MAG: hypothetical protein WCE20_10805 [Rhizomicrobium sp.]
MKYPTTMSAAVRFWHPSASVKEIEDAFGQAASVSHEVGQLRTHGDKAPHRETYCNFDLVPSKSVDAGDLISTCLGILKRRHSAIVTLLASGGTMILAVKLVDRSFVQLYLEQSQIAALASAGVGLVFE